MVSLEELRQKISEYCNTYRRDDLPDIEESPIYYLDHKKSTHVDKDIPRWPARYPFAYRKGLYAIFSNEQVLYIGKASFQTLGNRLGSYFRYADDKVGCITNKAHTWSKEPTHFVTWAVPDKMAFEASALEEYLLHAFKGRLSDNVIGNKA